MTELPGLPDAAVREFHNEPRELHPAELGPPLEWAEWCMLTGRGTVAAMLGSMTSAQPY